MKKFLSKRSILVGALALALGFIVSSCSRDKDDDAVYTACRFNIIVTIQETALLTAL